MACVPRRGDAKVEQSPGEENGGSVRPAESPCASDVNHDAPAPGSDQQAAWELADPAYRDDPTERACCQARRQRRARSTAPA
jgi:hypothetical protein